MYFIILVLSYSIQTEQLPLTLRIMKITLKSLEILEMK